VSFSLFELARFMGTSVEQIDGHLLPDALGRTRPTLDVFVGRDDETTHLSREVRVTEI
jgi:hypothetical protein